MRIQQSVGSIFFVLLQDGRFPALHPAVLLLRRLLTPVERLRQAGAELSAWSSDSILPVLFFLLVLVLLVLPVAFLALLVLLLLLFLLIFPWRRRGRHLRGFTS